MMCFSPVSSLVSSASPSMQCTSSTWLAYQNVDSVPAYSTVSWKEKPTFSLARTIRRLRQFSVLMSASVSLISSRLRTITWVSLAC